MRSSFPIVSWRSPAPSFGSAMHWNFNPNRRTLEDIEDLSHPPSGGRVKMILLGIMLPLLIAAYANGIWTAEEATWFGNGRGGNLKVKGETARSLAVCYLAAASFAHFRWFWGLKPSYRIFEIGTVLSLLAGLGGFVAGLYYAFR